MTSVELRKYVQHQCENTAQWSRVCGVAEQLRSHMSSRAVARRIKEANRPGASSAVVQASFVEFARELGFESEKTGLFGEADLALRPDYFLELEPGSGILLEVERGKTTINNMDLLDFWKCHLCPGANYLFLMVPRELRQNEEMSPRREFAAVDRRLKSFFVELNYTNVRGLCLFGY